MSKEKDNYCARRIQKKRENTISTLDIKYDFIDCDVREGLGQINVCEESKCIKEKTYKHQM